MADDDDEFEERPRRRKARRGDDEFEEGPRPGSESRNLGKYDDEGRPRHRSGARGREDDDEDDRPRRRARRDEYEGGDGEHESRRRRKLTRADLRAIAGCQKAIILCIGVYLCLLVGQFALPEKLRIVLAIALIPLALTAAVFVFMLAIKTFDTGIAVMLSVLTLIPCIGLIALLIINAKATGILTSRGIHVGLFGARMSDL